MTTDVLALVFLLIKILALTAIGLYAIFAGIMLRQEQLMAGVLEESFEPMLRLITLFHFISSIGLFILAVILL